MQKILFYFFGANYFYVEPGVACGPCALVKIFERSGECVCSERALNIFLTLKSFLTSPVSAASALSIVRVIIFNKYDLIHFLISFSIQSKRPASQTDQNEIYSPLPPPRSI